MKSNNLYKKEKILIVGAFPENNKQIFGGIITSCNSLINSSFVDKFHIIKLDSTQSSNPPPNLFIRTLFAIKRLIIFFVLIIIKRPKAVILFIALEASLIEKGTMGFIARLFRIKVLNFPRGTRLISFSEKNTFNNFIVKFFFHSGNYFLCQGPTWQNFAINNLGYNNKTAPIIPNWTATNSILSIGEQRIFNNNIEITELLFLGWLEKEKGIFELLESFVFLSKTYNLKLTIAGDGTANLQAKKIIRDSGLEDKVTFTGWIFGEKLNDVFKKCQILVLPSWSEGLPNAMIESMAAKLAVVVTNVGNIPDLLTNKKQALIVPKKNIETLTIAIESLILDKELFHSIAEEGYHFVKEHYSVEPAVNLLSKVINNAISKHNNE